MESEEEAEHSHEYLEKGILRNSKRFSAVFKRIYFKYNQEFERDEPGGKELDCNDLLHWKENKETEEESDRERHQRGKRFSSHDLLDDVSSESEGEEEEEEDADAELTALLHRRVIQVKKEICWDEEEQRSRERSEQKMAALGGHDDTTSSESERSESEIMKLGGAGCKTRRCRQKKQRHVVGPATLRRQSRRGSSFTGDMSETLYETEYQSELDPSCVHSEPEERAHVTPLRGMMKREAYSTPRGPPRKRRRLLPSSVVRELGKKLSDPCLSDKVKVENVVHSEEEFISGYNTASGYHSGSGEHVASGDSADSGTLKYTGMPRALSREVSPIPDILCPPPSKPASLPPQEERETDSSCTCTCTYGHNERDASHDKLCDDLVSTSVVVHSTNITHISYGHCGHAVSMNGPPCFHCCAVQSCDACCKCQHPHYHHAHSSHPPCHPTHWPL